MSRHQSRKRTYDGPRAAVVSTCALTQWAMDIHGNTERILQSIQKAKADGSRYRCGPELDITGYGCGDHFHEANTLLEAWKVVGRLMKDPSCTDILVDVGLPVQHKNVIYNCKLVFLNKKVLLVRPKMMLADDSHIGYQETRWFSPWHKVGQVEDHPLPLCITNVTGQTSVPFGDALVVTRDATIGYEICEELWNCESPHVGMSLDGAEIIANGSAALLEVGRPDNAYQMVKSATTKNGGCYLYANMKGCDGGLEYYPGDACIAVNGEIVGSSRQFSLPEVQVVTATVSLDSVATYRNLIRSRSARAAASPAYPRVQADFWLCTDYVKLPSPPKEPWLPSPAEQVLEGVACWLWDFLRRSGRGGLLLPLAGDLPSAATAAVVACMCHKVVTAAAKNSKVAKEVRRMYGEVPEGPRELCGRLLHTLYMPPHSPNQRAAHLANTLAEQLGSQHRSCSLEGGVTALLEAYRSATDGEGEREGERDSGEAATNEEGEGEAGHGREELLALHHLRAHLRAALTRLFAHRAPRGRAGEAEHAGKRQLVVLASYLADDPPDAWHLKLGSSAKLSDKFGDISVTGHVSRKVIRQVLTQAAHKLSLPALEEVLARDDEVGEEQKKEEEAWREMCKLQATEHLGPHGVLCCMMDKSKNAVEVTERLEKFYPNYGEGTVSSAGAPSCYLGGSGPARPVRPHLYRDNWILDFISNRGDVFYNKEP